VSYGWARKPEFPVVSSTDKGRPILAPYIGASVSEQEFKAVLYLLSYY
jgi:hypothetical protein